MISPFQISNSAKNRRLNVSGGKIYTSNHGHKFRSIFERDLDNWLWNTGVTSHKHSVKYPGSNMDCDIVVGPFWIEAAGLLGNKWYDKKMDKKKSIANKNSLNLIIISMKDFYISRSIESKLGLIVEQYGQPCNLSLTKFAQGCAR